MKFTEKNEKCVVITGASGGIGTALASAFLAAGYRVIAIDRTEAPDADHPCIEYLQADLQSIVDSPEYAHEFSSNLKTSINAAPVVGLINNAAVQKVATVEDLTRAVWAATMDVNVLAPFFLLQTLLGELIDTGGCVVNIGSIHAGLTKPGFTAYATSKAALRGLTQATAVELGARVRVNLIEPAAIETDMLKAGFEGHSEGFAALGACHPVGRIGTPEEVARLALQIIEGDLKFLNGSIIRLDGGIGARLHDPT